jgi:hypothetical protein
MQHDPDLRDVLFVFVFVQKAEQSKTHSARKRPVNQQLTLKGRRTPVNHQWTQKLRPASGSGKSMLTKAAPLPTDQAH